MDRTTGSTDELIDRLAQCASRLRSLADRQTSAQRWSANAGDGWSPIEILAHMRASDAILSPRILHILVRDNPPLPRFDERRWAEVARFNDLPASELVHAHSVARAELVHALRRIDAANWQRTGTHDEEGVVSILEIAEHVADHEEEHLADLEKMLG